MAWSIQASGHAVDAESERALYQNLEAVLGNEKYGVSASQFAGETVAGTPGIPEPEPEPALPTLSLEAQNAELRDYISQLEIQLAAERGSA